MSNISGIVKSARNIMRQDTGTGSDELRILQLGWMLFGGSRLPSQRGPVVSNGAEDRARGGDNPSNKIFR